MRLKELCGKEGCVLAVVIDNEGNCLACEHKEGQHNPSFDRVTQALSEVTSAMDKLSVELELATGRSCLPQEGWALLGESLSVIMGNGGFRGIVIDKESSEQLKTLQRCFDMLDEPGTGPCHGTVQLNEAEGL